jgi:hypothetical protein
MLIIKLEVSYDESFNCFVNGNNKEKTKKTFNYSILELPYFPHVNRLLSQIIFIDFT